MVRCNPSLFTYLPRNAIDSFCRGRLNTIAKEYWEEADANRRQKIAIIAAKGAWGIGTLVLVCTFLD